MARPITATPTLKGRDAERFIDEMENPRYSAKKARVIEEAEKLFKKNQF